MDSWEASADPGEFAGASDVEARLGVNGNSGVVPFPSGDLGESRFETGWCLESW